MHGGRGTSTLLWYWIRFAKLPQVELLHTPIAYLPNAPAQARATGEKRPMGKKAYAVARRLQRMDG